MPLPVLAVDVSIPDTVRECLQGIEIVRKARPKEPDESWVKDAVRLGATLLVSSDRDVHELAEKYRVHALRIPPRLRGKQIGSWIALSIYVLSLFSEKRRTVALAGLNALARKFNRKGEIDPSPLGVLLLQLAVESPDGIPDDDGPW